MPKHAPKIGQPIRLWLYLWAIYASYTVSAESAKLSLWIEPILPSNSCQPWILDWNHLPHNTLESALVPLDCLLLCDPMTCTDPTLCPSALRNPLTRPGHAAVEVHAVNANGRVIFDTQVDMFADTKAEVACLREVTWTEFVFFDFETAFKDFLSFGTSDGDVDSNFLIATNTL